MAGIDLLALQKAFIQEQRNIAKSLSSDMVLVPSIPLTCSGHAKTDKHYITPEGLEVSCLRLLRKLQNE